VFILRSKEAVMADVQEPTDREFHASSLESLIGEESGKGKGIAWDWTGDFQTALESWIALELDLFVQSTGEQKKHKLINVKAEVLSFWPEDGEEVIKLTWPDTRSPGGFLMVEVKPLCGGADQPSVLLLRFLISIKGRAIKPGWNMVGVVVRKGDRVRIHRNYKLGKCPSA